MTLPTDKLAESVSFGVKERNKDLDLRRMIEIYELVPELLIQLQAFSSALQDLGHSNMSQALWILGDKIRLIRTKDFNNKL